MDFWICANRLKFLANRTLTHYYRKSQAMVTTCAIVTITDINKKSTYVNDRSFLTRMLFRDSYWLFYLSSLLFLCVSLRSLNVFLNEYMDMNIDMIGYWHHTVVCPSVWDAVDCGAQGRCRGWKLYGVFLGRHFLLISSYAFAIGSIVNPQHTAKNRTA